jgi:8-oxo-dGTP pyrophosphatase MutT (NUDIX family)
VAEAAPEPKPSATVVLLRDGPGELEFLLLQRGSRKGRTGPWVFPGGKVEPIDLVGDPDSQESARRAAVRETREESGLTIRESALHSISRWITPEISPRRFDTWFFLGGLDRDEPVRVDGGEIVDHRWLSPGAALLAHEAREIQLAPPTFVTVSWLTGFARAEHALQELPAREFVTFRPRICRSGDGAVMLYPGDAGYESGDPSAPGPRHRVWADEGWRYRYERS